MHPGLKKALGAAVLAPGLLVLTLFAGRGAGDEPRGLGRLFRFGGSSTPDTPAPPPAPPVVNDTGAPAATGAPPSVVPPSSNAPGNLSAAPRIVPQPRVVRAITDADPLVTRIALVRSSDGNQFGVFLQVFADGTIIDGEGAHRVGRDALKPVIDALQESDLSRIKGHCGAPAIDFTEYVHLITYERSFGKLRANSLSYSGNPQGCDHAIQHLHNALDALQAKISRPPAVANGTGPGTAPAANAPSPPALPTGANSIPLTPVD